MFTASALPGRLAVGSHSVPQCPLRGGGGGGGGRPGAFGRAVGSKLRSKTRSKGRAAPCDRYHDEGWGTSG